MKTQKYIMNLPVDLREKMQAHADEKGISLADYVRMVLSEREKLEAKKK